MNIIKPAMEIIVPDDKTLASVGFAGGLAEFLSARGRYWAQLKDASGKILFEEEFPNLVTTVGGNFILDTTLGGSGYTAAWYIGLISSSSYTTGPAAGDTMASHGGWTESVAYSNSTRVVTAWNAASARSKSLSAALVFNINASDTIKGCFMNTVSTKSGTTGTLLSAGLFTGGDQPVVSGNTLSVSYSLAV